MKPLKKEAEVWLECNPECKRIEGCCCGDGFLLKDVLSAKEWLKNKFNDLSFKRIRSEEDNDIAILKLKWLIDEAFDFGEEDD